MIQANELRIGNYLEFNEGQYAPVAPLFLYLLGSGRHDELTPYRPIPLTPEILEKAGFKMTNKVSVMFKRYTNVEDNECIYLALDAVGTNNFNIVYSYKNEHCDIKRRISTLHELQNLIHALTGEELPITL